LKLRSKFYETSLASEHFTHSNMHSMPRNITILAIHLVQKV